MLLQQGDAVTILFTAADITSQWFFCPVRFEFDTFCTPTDHLRLKIRVSLSILKHEVILRVHQSKKAMIWPSSNHKRVLAWMVGKHSSSYKSAMLG